MSRPNFNPHTREGCDEMIYEAGGLIGISIHTPVKGVTGTSGSRTSRRPYFNPHTREGCDLEGRGCHADHSQISIHTPVKGVTIAANAVTTEKIKFQSTHP